MSTPIRSPSPPEVPLHISPIPIFQDNYVWLIRRGNQAVVVDPGDSGPVKQALENLGLELTAILVTHHHPDHIGGIADLCADAAMPIIGPRAESDTIGMLTERVDDGDWVTVLGARAQVLSIPGHTLGHIAFHFAESQLLFCGDTLFSGGCGRLFEGTPAQMLNSLSRLARLPEATSVYCAHEYTLSNLAFACAVEDHNAALMAYRRQVQQQRDQKRPSLPSSIGVELKINPFMRTALPSVQSAVAAHTGLPRSTQEAVFADLRAWKDTFQAPAAV